MRLLLHCCCGPCASACVPRLRAEGHEVTLFFANSNIDTAAEFERRVSAARRLAEADGVGFVAAPYDHAKWLREAAAGFEGEPEKGARCARCFRFSLGECARYAAEHDYEGFCSSLTVSPHKVSAMVFEAGRASETAAAPFVPADFKKRQGFLVSVRRTKELGLYRQAYCGCEFSRRGANRGDD